MDQEIGIRPPEAVSKESDRAQLALAEEQGDAYEAAVREMVEHVARGAEQRAGDYIVAYAIEKAEGMWELNNGHLEWTEPGEDNVHLEVSVRDANDGRFIPGLTVHATLLTTSGNLITGQVLPFLWHPWMYHYGKNLIVPWNGEYVLTVHIDPAPFSRHDKINGKRYGDSVDVEFKPVVVDTVQETH